MKSSIQIITAVAMFFVMLYAGTIFAQVPQLFNYQGIARDAKGNPLSNQSMSLKLSVLPTADATVAEYEEIQTVKTNEFGLYTLQIGNGMSVVGQMKTVKWESGNKYIKVGIDPSGGSNYLDAGTNQLLSVPYAIYADKAGTAIQSDHDKTRAPGAVNSDPGHTPSDANYITKYTAENVIGKSSMYQSPSTGNIGLGTITPSSLAKLHIFQNAGNQEFLRMQNTDPNAFGKFIMYNDNPSSYATFTKYGTTYSGAYTGLGAMYPYANLLAFGNNSSANGNGNFLISTTGNAGISLSKAGTSKLKFHADYLSENVGIGGNANPVSRVHLNNTDSSVMTVRVTNNITGHTTNDGLLITQNGNASSMVNKENNSLAFGTNNLTRMTIMAAGNVGVNTVSPPATTQLHVNGTGKATGIYAVADQQTTPQTDFGINYPIYNPGWLPLLEAIGIHGVTRASTATGNANSYGVVGTAVSNNTLNNIGIMGEARSANGYNTGVAGRTFGLATAGNYAISGEAPLSPNSWAGFFKGKVRIQDGSEGIDKVFCGSDALGTGTWKDVCTLPCIVALTTSVSAAGNDWKLNGNTVGVSGKYLGTNDNYPLQFKVNANNAGIIDNTKHNTYVGYDAGTANLPIPGANDNTGIGFNALKNNISYRNTAIGQIALEQNTTGFQNTAIGDQAMTSNTTGLNNTSVGHQSMHDNVIGNNNTAMGINTLFANTSGNDNSAIGFSALGSNTSGGWNVANGTYALSANTIGAGNVAMGGNSLQQNTTGNNNAALGGSALKTNTIGSFNAALGTDADVASNNLNYATAIGSGATVGQSNTIVLGRTTPLVTDRVGINTTLPHSALQVVGSFATNIKSIQANTTATIDDYTFICLATLTLTLPNPINCKGRIYVIKRNSAVALISINTPSGTALIDAPAGFGSSSSALLNSPSQIGVTYQSDGNSWIKIASAE